jgi:peroxiredoxin family protein
MDILVKVISGYSDSIIPSLIMALKLKGERKEVVVFFEWRALVAFAEKRFEYSPSVAKYTTAIEENAAKMGLPFDPMDYLKGAKAAGIPLYGCAVEAALSGVTEKVPSEIQLMEEKDLSKSVLEAKKIISGF